jgi:flagellar basal-body rod modification protein FlgD
MSPSIGSTIAPSAADTVTQTAQSNDPLASESTFMTLLVSQLQNQDPLNPTDSTEFVSQLTEYSQLEQLMDINQNTTPAATTTNPATTPDPTTGTQPTTGT